MKRFTRIIKILLGVIAGILILLLLLISPLAEYLIEKNSREWAGRKIEMERLGINLLSGGVSIKQLKIYETDDHNLFVTVNKIRINAALFSFISGRNIIEEALIQDAIN